MNGDLDTDSLAILSPIDGSTLMAHPNVIYWDASPITFDLKGAAGAWAIEEDQNGRLWVAGQFTQGGGRKLTGIARFSQTAGSDAAVTACTVTRDGAGATVEWENQVAPDAFVIRRSVNGGTVFWRGRSDGNTSSFTDTDGQVPLSYTVESRVGPSRLGEAVVCTEVIGELVPPTGLRATLVTRERVVLNWSGAGAIEIERNGVIIGTDSDRWYTDRSVAPGTTYEYRVRYSGQQAWSDPISVTTH